MVTGLMFGGALLWRRNSWGYIVAGVAGIQASLYLLVLSINSIVAIHRGLVKAPGELPMWGTLGLATVVVTLILMANIRRNGTVSGRRNSSGSVRIFVDGATEGRRARM
jgi:hypothetical protein